MFKPAKRLLIAVTTMLAISTPSAAYARFFEYGSPAGSHTSAQAQPSINAAKLRQLDQLQVSVAQRFHSEGGWPSTASHASVASAVHLVRPSSEAGSLWGDVGIGGAGVLTLVGIGAGATVVIRRRIREQLAN